MVMSIIAGNSTSGKRRYWIYTDDNWEYNGRYNIVDTVHNCRYVTELTEGYIAAEAVKITVCKYYASGNCNHR